jgi:hypothetical protein
MTRRIRDIAHDIENDWSRQGKGVNYAAKPYLNAMFFLTDKNSAYGMDDATTVVLYFLSNASSYRGELARSLKAELKEAIK